MSVAGKGYMYVFRAMVRCPLHVDDPENSTRSASGYSQVIGFVPTLRISEMQAHTRIKESRYPREILFLLIF